MSAASAKTQDPSMDEILASIRRIIADDGDGPSEPTKPAANGTGKDRDDEDVLDLANLPDAQRRPAVELDLEMPDLSFQDAADPAVDAPPPSAPPPARLESAAPPRPEPGPARAEPTREELLSRDTTASVGHAFQLLSHTVLAQNHRTLEDLVKEMLRPMLKEWLDDNLPPLVERLVRHEIERVARGTR